MEKSAYYRKLVPESRAKVVINMAFRCFEIIFIRIWKSLVLQTKEALHFWKQSLMHHADRIVEDQTAKRKVDGGGPAHDREEQGFYWFLFTSLSQV